MRYARPSRLRRCGSKLAAEFDAPAKLTACAPPDLPAPVPGRCAANHDAHASLAVAEGVLDRWVDLRGGDCKNQTDNGAREVPLQSNVRRHGLGIPGEHGAQNRGTGVLCSLSQKTGSWLGLI